MSFGYEKSKRWWDNPKPKRIKMAKFKKGDRVKCIGGMQAGGTGVVLDYNSGSVGVKFDIPSSEMHSLGGLCKDEEGWWCNESDLEYDTNAAPTVASSPVHKEPEKPKEISPDALDALIIDPEIKSEILAVLKQHQNKDKIFTEWGLGETIEYGKGMTFLFWGTPGTGKTWAATLMAKALGTDLITLTAAEIQSSEPGAANRNIQQAFKTAKEEKKVILLDECDSLIFDRKHLGMVLASEVNTLLTEIEKFEGVCILATNQVNRMDEALERRISLIVEFPKPNREQRAAIWKRMIPEKLPLAEGVTHETLADHELTGGLIKNVLLNAARMASSNGDDKVTAETFDKAIARVKKSKNLMGKSSGQMATHGDGMSVGTGSSITKKTNIDDFFSRSLT